MNLLRSFESGLQKRDGGGEFAVERVCMPQHGPIPRQRKLKSNPGPMLDGCKRYRRRRSCIAADQVGSGMMITDDGHVEGVLLREGLRALQNREGSVKMAPMRERRSKYRHRVQEQRPCRPEIADTRRIAHVLWKICRQKLDRAFVISANPAGVPQCETRAIRKSLILEAIGHFKGAAADVNRLP